MTRRSLVFSTCWYSLGAKFDDTTYSQWMNNMLSTATHYNLVVYTDTYLYDGFVQKYATRPNIHIVLLPIAEFVVYKELGETFWVNNHQKNRLLNRLVHWKVNMLWCEKPHFVARTARARYFDEPPDETWYGWIDIGYFRCRANDVPYEKLREIPNYDVLNYRLSKDKIHFVLVNPDYRQIEQYIYWVATGRQLPDNQISVGGGCFLCYGAAQVEFWRDLFMTNLYSYYDNNSIVKDDQIIIATSIFQRLDRFVLHMPPLGPYDPWFFFTSILLGHYTIVPDDASSVDL